MVREDFIGLSTDTKRTDVANGSTFYCADNSKAYVFLNGTWYEKTADEPTPPTPSDDWGTVTYLNDDSQSVTATLQSMTEVESLCNISYNANHKATIDGVEVPFNKLIKVNLGNSVTSLGDKFLYNAANVVEVTAPKLEVAGSEFLYGTSSMLDKDMNFPELEYLGGYSFQGNYTGEFNMPKLRVCGYGFLQGANPSNEVLSFPALEETAGRFMYNASSFNAPLNLPKLKITGQQFLYNASSFNSSIDISSVEEIYSDFMKNCSSFNQNLTLPASVVRVLGSDQPKICDGCDAFTAQLTINFPPTVIAQSPAAYNTYYIMRSSSTTSALATTGFELLGDYASDWKSIVPDNNYRKIRNR